MKAIIISLLLVFLTGFGLQAQKKVKERDLKGQWKMIFDIDEEFIEEELDKEDLPWIGRLVAEGVGDIVLNIMDEIDVRFEFQENHQLKIIIDVFNEKEVEYARWYIDSAGGLVLDDDDDDNDIWLFKGDRLVAYEKEHGRLKKQPVYLERVH